MKWALVALLLLTGSAQAMPKVLKNVHPSLPNPSRFFTTTTTLAASLTMFGIGIPWCGATALLIRAGMEGRPLRLGEAWESAASCVVPILGGLLVHHYWRAEWDELPTKTVRYEGGIITQH